MSRAMKEREPCPFRILDDTGNSFALGAIGGTAWHFLVGVRNSPKGVRFLGGKQSAIMNASRTAGSFAVWGAMFSSIDCTMVYLRKKEDPWNSIISGAATGGLLSMRRGLGASAKSALFGGFILALIEGGGIMKNKLMAQEQNSADEMGQFPYQLPFDIESSGHDSTTSSSWFGRFFGRKKEEAGLSSASKTEVVESFDLTSPVPMPVFE